METILVTRHPALIHFLQEKGVIDNNTHIVEHATVEDVRGKFVIGVLPMWLAAEAVAISEVKLDIPIESRGKELSLDEVKQYFRGFATYEVEAVDEELIEEWTHDLR